jgi:hypothetical protein
MPKKLSLEISDETYDHMMRLAEGFGLDCKSIANSILEAVSSRERDITQLREMPGVEANLSYILNDALENYPTFAYTARDLLTKLKAKGSFSIDSANVEWSIEKDFFSVILTPDSSADYDFYMINVRKEDGRYNLGTYTSVEIGETKDNSFDGLSEAAESIDCPFDVDDYRVDADDSDENSCTLSIDYWADSLECLPSLKEADRFIKQILKKAKVTLKK